MYSDGSLADKEQREGNKIATILWLNMSMAFVCMHWEMLYRISYVVMSVCARQISVFFNAYHLLDVITRSPELQVRLPK